VHPADMSLRPFIENVRSNALQREQLAQELYARRGEPELLRRAVEARGKASAYEHVLLRLEEDVTQERVPRSPRITNWRLPKGLPMRLAGAAAIAGLCVFIFAVIYGLERPIPESHSTAARRTLALPTSPAEPPTSGVSNPRQSIGPSSDAVSEPAQSAPSETATLSEPPAADALPAPLVTMELPQRPADFSPNALDTPTAADSPSGPETPAALLVAAPTSPPLMTTQIVRSLPFTGGKVVTVVVGRYCQDSTGGQIFIPMNAPSPSLTC